MYHNFEEVLERAKKKEPVTVSVAVAHDKDVLRAIKKAEDMGLAKAILVGDSSLIKALIEKLGFKQNPKIIHEENEEKAVLKAVSQVQDKKAQVLMKGLVKSGEFLKGVLNEEVGLKTKGSLSHMAALEIPGHSKLLFITDGGMNIAPNLMKKKDILMNTITYLKTVGYENPKIALLTATETITPKMQATMDARDLVDMFQREKVKAVIEGPIAFDVAISEEATKSKGINSKITGKVDGFLVPNIETGNALSKTLIYLANAKMGGLVLGATNPIVMTSRAESVQGKLYSIALASLAIK